MKPLAIFARGYLLLKVDFILQDVVGTDIVDNNQNDIFNDFISEQRAVIYTNI